MLSGRQFHLVDWESASLGPPGATLRFFSNWPLSDKRRIAAGYARHRARRGHPVSVRDVLFAMHLHQAFWAFRTAARQKKPDRLLLGWRLFQELVAHVTSGSNANDVPACPARA